MKKVVRIKVGGEVDVLDVPAVGMECSALAKLIECEWIEIVRTERLEKGCIMICDEEGLLKENCGVNVTASWLYGMDKHGQPIAGDVLIIKEEYGKEGPEFAGMEEEDAVRFAEQFKRIYAECDGVTLFARGIAAAVIRIIPSE